jgi:hypothetical protein
MDEDYDGDGADRRLPEFTRPVLSASRAEAGTLQQLQFFGRFSVTAQAMFLADHAQSIPAMALWHAVLSLASANRSALLNTPGVWNVLIGLVPSIPANERAYVSFLGVPVGATPSCGKLM